MTIVLLISIAPAQATIIAAFIGATATIIAAYFRGRR